MTTSILLEIIIGTSTTGAMLFGVFNYFKNPQVRADKDDALMAQSIKQLQIDLTNLRDNHVHTLDTKLDQTITNVAQMAIQLAQLSTIIDERIPRGKN